MSEPKQVYECSTVHAMKKLVLQSEMVSYYKRTKKHPRIQLSACGDLVECQKVIGKVLRA